MQYVSCMYVLHHQYAVQVSLESFSTYHYDYEGYRYLVVTWYVYSKCNSIWFCKMNEADPDVFLILGFGNASLFFKPPKPRTIIL